MTEGEIRKEIGKLQEKRLKYLQQRNMVKAFGVDEELRRLEQKLIWMADNETVALRDLIKDKPELEEKFNIQTILLTGLVNATDGALVEMNSLIQNLTDGRQMMITGRMERIKKESAAVIRLLDFNSSEETAEDYGDFGDRIYARALKMAEEHLSWLQMEENTKIKYAE